MKTKLLPWCVVLLGLITSTSAFSTSITVGTAVSNTGNCLPFACNEGPTTGQSIDYRQIYSSAAFAAPIAFNTVTFFNTQVPAGPLMTGNYSITFSYTSAVVGGASAYPVAATGTQAFFSGALGGPIGTSFSIVGTSFAYDPGLGNLLMEVVVTDQTSINLALATFLDADFSGCATNEALACGTSVVSRAISVPGNDPYSDSSGLVTEFSTTPLPATLRLFVGGVGVIGMLARRRRQTAACG